MRWVNFYAVFPVDTRQLLVVLLPDLMVDADQLADGDGSAAHSPVGQILANGYRARYRPGGNKMYVNIQTAAVGPGIYHLRVKTAGSDWSPWMEPQALKMYLILDHPGMFMVAE